LIHPKQVSMASSSDTISLSDFHSRLRDHLAHSKATGRPLFGTSNGQTDAVVLSPATFDQLMGQAELAKSLATLDRSAEDVKAGRTRPAKTGLRQIADELNLTLNRE
jgi:PHD/YefM family antitoxin component YafN of YafNO toxin-antitoxin module